MPSEWRYPWALSSASASPRPRARARGVRRARPLPRGGSRKVHRRRFARSAHRAGSGVSLVMPACSRALELTHVLWPSRLGRYTNRSGTSASSSSLVGVPPGKTSIDHPPPEDPLALRVLLGVRLDREQVLLLGREVVQVALEHVEAPRPPDGRARPGSRARASGRGGRRPRSPGRRVPGCHRRCRRRRCARREPRPRGPTNGPHRPCRRPRSRSLDRRSRSCSSGAFPPCSDAARRISRRGCRGHGSRSQASDTRSRRSSSQYPSAASGIIRTRSGANAWTNSIVAHDDHRAGPSLQRLGDRRSRGRIEVVRRLVEQQQVLVSRRRVAPARASSSRRPRACRHPGTRSSRSGRTYRAAPELLVVGGRGCLHV